MKRPFLHISGPCSRKTVEVRVLSSALIAGKQVKDLPPLELATRWFAAAQRKSVNGVREIRTPSKIPGVLEVVFA